MVQQSLLWTAYQTRTRRDAMGNQWQANMVCRPMGGTLVDGTLQARDPAYHPALYVRRERGRLAARGP